jgi:tRNA nucleotidyltransferase (CCA-adding enzyme)
MMTINLTEQIHQRLPHELVEFIRGAGEAASGAGYNLYLVGGVVRDLLLRRNNLDLDLVVEGDAVKLAQELSKKQLGNLVIHSHFKTATIRWSKWNVDFITARSESYSRPGALPDIKPGSIEDDLARRDFTINSMALSLVPDHYGTLLDPSKGRLDIERRLIRILHDKSFIDDATRIWRAIRYEQRLDFRIEQRTLELLHRDITYLDTISGDRLRHELEHVLQEEKPEKILRRAGEMGVLSRLHPSLKADEWLMQLIAKSRGLSGDHTLPEELLLALLIYNLDIEGIKQFGLHLNLPAATLKVLLETLELKNKLASLAVSKIALSRIYSLLHNISQPAIIANLLACDSPLARERIDLYLTRLRHINPLLNGDELIELGVPPGPRIKETLESIRKAKLDGKITTRQEEEKLVKKRLAYNPTPSF